jgi:hypothetical protein
VSDDEPERELVSDDEPERVYVLVELDGLGLLPLLVGIVYGALVGAGVALLVVWLT